MKKIRKLAKEKKLPKPGAKVSFLPRSPEIERLRADWAADRVVVEAAKHLEGDKSPVVQKYGKLAFGAAGMLAQLFGVADKIKIRADDGTDVPLTQDCAAPVAIAMEAMLDLVMQEKDGEALREIPKIPDREVRVIRDQQGVPKTAPRSKRIARNKANANAGAKSAKAKKGPAS